MKIFRWVLLLFLAFFLVFSGGLVIRGLAFERVTTENYSHNKDADRYLALPYSGVNYTANSLPGYGAGRYFLKGRTAAAVVAAYAGLAKDKSEKVYLYGEMGWEGGGSFYPHRTHKEGLSADFMTPVYKKNDAGDYVSLPLPCSAANLWGYGIRFGDDGRYGEYLIDFEAMADHLAALKLAGAHYRVRIKRVIFDPPLLALLKKHPSFKKIKGMQFMGQKAWFPHDGHYHVDFEAY